MDSRSASGADLRRLIERAFTAYERHLLRAIVALAEFDGRELGIRLNYIAAVSSLDGSWDHAHDELPPIVAMLNDECPPAARHLRRALKHLKTATRALRLIDLD
jgi:hypothetical protein